MSYLRFDKTLMINLEESLPREILRTNKSGAYHCTTIVDCNTLPTWMMRIMCYSLLWMRR